MTLRSYQTLPSGGHTVSLSPSAGKTFPAQGKPGECAWFVRCENPATTTRPHPILGAVPICDRCNERVEKLT